MNLPDLIFYNAPIPIAFVNKKGEFTKVNEQWSKLLGYSMSELQKTTFKTITHPEDLAPDIEMVNKLLDNSNGINRYTMTKRYITKDDKTMWVKLTVIALRDDDDNFEEFIAYVVPVQGMDNTFNLESIEGTQIKRRPRYSLDSLWNKNWQFFITWGLPTIGALIYFIFRVWSAFKTLLHKNDIEWGE